MRRNYKYKLSVYDRFVVVCNECKKKKAYFMPPVEMRIGFRSSDLKNKVYSDNYFIRTKYVYYRRLLRYLDWYLNWISKDGLFWSVSSRSIRIQLNSNRHLLFHWSHNPLPCSMSILDYCTCL